MGSAISRQGKVRVGIVAGAVLVCALVAAAVVTARGGPTTPAELDSAISSEPLVKVFDLPKQEGSPQRSMFIQPTSAGFLCTWVAENKASKLRQGECNPDDDPLVGNALWATLTYDGGPSVESVRDARLVGLATEAAGRVAVLMSDGSTRDAKVKRTEVEAGAFQAFAYRVRRSDLKSGIGPTAVVAYDVSGRELGRQTTGIG